ncbi:hypothetical protein [Vibrio sp. 10N.222.54.B6]|uniref:hypothetical protein n=1 Tax=Vibrio sp. 10N.222.54.B6 TaxID=1884468 RepID=UPI001F534685|nr:hypothetical protein [Vibrio sp. 10N.222.54.B6]
MITPKSDHQIDLECIEFVVTSVYKLVETSLHATPYSIWVFHDLALVLDKYADSMMTSGMVMFHDVRLHAQSPGLTLAKYYCALKQTEGHLDRSMVWEKHLQWCQALSFALYEHCQDPRSDICYGEKTVIIDKPHNRQCYSYTTIKKPVSFQLNRYQYRQQPWQWQD